jgi:hydroxymethylbilane synthase
MDMADNISLVMDPHQFVPAPGQGALAIQTRTDDTELIEMLSPIDDANARITTDVERHILAALHGGCSIPLGVYSQVNGDEIEIIAVISDVKAVNFIRKTAICSISEAEFAAEKIANELLESGGRKILDDIRSENK